jgi:hypothetical protein
MYIDIALTGLLFFQIKKTKNRWWLYGWKLSLQGYRVRQKRFCGNQGRIKPILYTVIAGQVAKAIPVAGRAQNNESHLNFNGPPK